MEKYIVAANELQGQSADWSYQQLCEELDKAYIDTETDIAQLY